MSLFNCFFTFFGRRNSFIDGVSSKSLCDKSVDVRKEGEVREDLVEDEDEDECEVEDEDELTEGIVTCCKYCSFKLNFFLGSALEIFVAGAFVSLGSFLGVKGFITLENDFLENILQYEGEPVCCCCCCCFLFSSFLLQPQSIT